MCKDGAGHGDNERDDDQMEIGNSDGDADKGDVGKRETNEQVGNVVGQSEENGCDRELETIGDPEEEEVRAGDCGVEDRIASAERGIMAWMERSGVFTGIGCEERQVRESDGGWQGANEEAVKKDRRI